VFADVSASSDDECDEGRHIDVTYSLKEGTQLVK
jgi:hypothetical protein